MDDWTPADARHTYNIAHWGDGYFDVGEAGTLLVRPDRTAGREIDLSALAAELRRAGLDLPVLVRFPGILHDRIDALIGAFDQATAADGFTGRFTPVYPIKVNQQRCVVEEIVGHGDGRVGLEAGSKPELMAVLALGPTGGTIVCNGYKDREYLRLALAGQALGHRVHLVIEKRSELEAVLEEAEALGVAPILGVRVRLASIGAGNWQNTGGEKSKFGLSAAQVLEIVERLRQAGRLGCLQLLHFHLGSQIANIRDIQRGTREAARFYAELHRLGVPLSTVDVGGGLGVDYEGTHSRSACSMNYSLAEYAHNVVHTLWEVCTELGLPHPDLVAEAGRALTAHHAVLVTDVIETERVPDGNGLAAPGEDEPLILHNLWQALQGLSERSVLEVYHEASHWLAEAQGMYTHGVLSLEQRALAEQLYFATCRRVHGLLRPEMRAQRAVLDELDEKLADKYFCNFSVFQSMPDVWGIDQVFPIVPLHRLDEAPERRGVIRDLTCDSDGRIDRYVAAEGVETTLPLHPPAPGEPYLLGFFLLGAYQEILGDMHNLFGDTDSVNVVLDEAGRYRLQSPARGDSVDDLLRYVHFEPDELMRAYRCQVDAADLDPEQRQRLLQQLAAGLQGCTYLDG